MPIHERYELLELLSELKQDLCIAGRDRNTDLPVVIHFLNSGNVDEDNAVLRATLAPEFKKHLIEVGHNHGTPYVITDSLPAGKSVRTWVADGTPAQPPDTGHADSATSQSGTFTRFLRAKGGNNFPDSRIDEPAVADALPEETSIAAAARQPELLPASAPAEDKTVDLLRRVPGTPESEADPPAVSYEAGELTRIFSESAPVHPPRPATPATTPLPWELPNPAARQESRNVPDLPDAGAFPWLEQAPAGNSADATDVFLPGRQSDANVGRGHKQGSGEYTRMMQSSSAAGSVEAKQDTPQAAKPVLASKTRFQSSLPLILILVALLMLAIVVIIIIVAKTRPSG